MFKKPDGWNHNQLGQADSWAETGRCHQVEDGTQPPPVSPLSPLSLTQAAALTREL